MKRAIGVSVLLLGVGMLASWYFWGALPERYPIHWNAAGVPDGFASKWIGALLLPWVGLGLSLLVAFLLRLDPRKANIEASMKAIEVIMIAMNGFFLALHLMSLQAAMSPKMHLSSQWMMLLLGGLFLCIGAVMPMLRSNFFAGIRTPWTLSSDVVWEKTHRFAAWSMGLAGLLTMLLGLFVKGQTGFFVAIALILVGSLLPVVYSYLLYRKEGLHHNHAT